MPKKDDYSDYFEDEELESWDEETIEELWDDDCGEFYHLMNEEKADEIRRRLNKDDS